MMLALQLIAALFSLFMLYLTHLYRRKNVFSRLDSYFWYGVWGCTFLASFFPQSIFSAKVLDVAGMDLVAAGAVVLMVAISFFNSRDIRRSQRKLEDLVRNLAMRDRSKR